jgi:hypothetical protein
VVEQSLLIARAAFVVLLYLFVWRVVRLSVRDVRAPQESLILSAAAARSVGLGSALADPPNPGVAGLALVVLASGVFPVGTRVLLDDAVLIGRAGDCDVVLAGDETVSGHHARTRRTQQGIVLVDLGSTNGTFLNDARVDGERLLAPGDVVRIGMTELTLEGPAAR